MLHISDDEIQLKEIFIPLMTNPTQSTENLNEPLDESQAKYWRKNAQDYLKSVLEDPEKEIKSRNAKNVIMFLGDGMSLSTVAAARMYVGGNENKQLSFEKFAHFGLSKVNSFTFIIIFFEYEYSTDFVCTRAQNVEVNAIDNGVRILF